MSTQPGGVPVTFTFDGTEVTAVRGQTLAAALMAAGIRTWGATRRAGSPRGLFCGIGVCYSCLVVVNGRPNVRACLVRVEDGDILSTQGRTSHDDLA